MKKFKIVTDGETFRVKVKDFLFWYFAGRIIHPDLPNEPFVFKTREEAARHVESWKKLDRARSWLDV